MAQEITITNNKKLYATLRRVMGENWLRYKQKFPDKRKDGYRVKICPAQMTDEQINEVIAIMRNEHNLTVDAYVGCSGYRMLPWVAFLVPYND